MPLRDTSGQRLYLTAEERAAFLEAARRAAPAVHTLCLLIHDTGIRESEALEVTPERIDPAGSVLIRSLKRHSTEQLFRSIPLPASTLELLDLTHGIREALRRGPPHAQRPLWNWSRSTVWRRLHEVMVVAGIPPGPHRCPKGLRHGYGIHAVRSGVPLHLLRKWMGHASMTTTAIYAANLGAEEQSIAARMWST